MNWYYAIQGQQTGPVDEAQLDALRNSGQIEAETLVWREGMANWQPYREARASAVPGAPAGGIAGVGAATTTAAATAEVVCAECGRVFPIDNTIQFGNVRVCAGCKPIFMQKLAEGARIGGGLVYASVWTRFGAVFLDGIILFVVNTLVGLVAGLTFVQAAGAQPGDQIRVQIILLIINMSIAAGYETLMIGKYGATLGKMAAKVRVVTAEGGRVSYARALGRYFSKFLSAMLCLIGYIIAFFDEEKRALHDRICNTRVVTR
jgi:uncharacterized RDD family membrane protein YckC